MITWDDICEFVNANQDKYIKDVFPNINRKFVPYKFSDLEIYNSNTWGDIGLHSEILRGLVDEDDFGFDLFSVRDHHITYLGKPPQDRQGIINFPYVILTIITHGKEDLI